MARVCQSCGIPLSDSILGTEKNYQRSQHYCKFCYRSGRFIDQHLTFEDMKKRGRHDICRSKNVFLLKWAMMLVYPLQLKKLKRWQKR